MNITSGSHPLSVPRYRFPTEEDEVRGTGSYAEGFYEGDYILDRTVIRACLCIAYTAVFILCFFGNLTVVIVLSLHWRMRNVTKFCMGNLAFANLCVAIFCIYQNLFTFLQGNWIFGQFFCKMYYFINSLSHTASVLILVVISVERYLSIVHPLKCRRLLTIQRLRLTIAGVWVLSGLISTPRLYYMTTMIIPFPPKPIKNAHEDAVLNGYGSSWVSNMTEMAHHVICAPTPTLYNSSTAEIVFFVVLFLSPLVVMSILYIRTASMICQSSALLQAVQSYEMDELPMPFAVRITIPQTPHNSLVTESSSCTFTKTVTSISHDFEDSISSATVLQAEGENTHVTDTGLTHSSGPRRLSVFTVGEILHRREGYNHPTTVLRVKEGKQGHAFKSRESAIRMLIIIVITFAVCNFPYHLRRIFQYYVRSYDICSSFNQFLTPVTFLLMYTNCAVNPIFFAFLSKNFRSSFKDLLRFRVRRRYYNGDGNHHHHRRRHHRHRAAVQGYVAQTSV